MLAGYLVSFILGIFTGIITGLVPGLHINLISIILVTFPFSKNIPSHFLIIYFVSLAITHTFLDFIPSIYLGAPSEDTIVSTLVGHKFLLKGKGHAAVDLTNKGSLLAIFILIILYPLFYFILPKVYHFIEKLIPLILIWVILLMIFSEKNKIKTVAIIFLSAILGIMTLNSNITQPLLPLLTGLFSTSTLLFSIKNKTKIPKQSQGIFHLSKKEFIKPTILTILVSPLFSLLPGLGSSQAAIISQKLLRKRTNKQHLILLGSINTIVIAISFLILYLLNKTRTGIASAMKELVNLRFKEILIILVTIIFTGLISFFLTRYISKKTSQLIGRVNYSKISIIVIILTTLISFWVSGIGGLIILISSTTLGLLCQEMKQKKSILITSIMIPTIYNLI